MKKYLRLFKMGKLERKAFAHNYKFSYLSIASKLRFPFTFGVLQTLTSSRPTLHCPA